MKTPLILLLTLVLSILSCHNKQKNGVPNDDSTIKLTPTDSTVATDAINRDTSAVRFDARLRNQAPIIKTGADQIITGTTLKLDGSKSSDPDGSLVSSVWLQEKGPLLVLVNNKKLVCTASNVGPGEYRFRLTITDNRGATATDTIHISKKGAVVIPPIDTIKPPPPPPPVNKPPTVKISGPTTVQLPSAAITFTATGTDPEGGAVAYKWSLPNALTNSVTIQYSDASVGTATYTVTVTDDKGATGFASINVTILAAPVGNGTRNNLTLQSTFENGSPGWNLTDQTCCSYSAGISSDFAFDGSKSMRVELRRGDSLISSSARSEIEPDAGSSNSASSEAWYGFAMYVPSDWAVSTNPESPIQFHQQPNVSGTEPVGLWISGANWQQMITKGLNVGNTYVDGPAVIKGAWTTVVMHIKWDAGTNGIVQTWINGVKFCDYKGVTNYPGQGYYAKVGAYKWYWQDSKTQDNVTKRIYYFDSFRIGTAAATYDDVKPGN